jgi:hypothetical protein
MNEVRCSEVPPATHAAMNDVRCGVVEQASLLPAGFAGRPSTSGDLSVPSWYGLHLKQEIHRE